jgi:hypothetical protein
LSAKHQAETCFLLQTLDVKILQNCTRSRSTSQLYRRECLNIDLPPPDKPSKIAGANMLDELCGCACNAKLFPLHPIHSNARKQITWCDVAHIHTFSPYT